MAKNKHIRGKLDKAASPAVVGYRSRDQQYAEGKAIRDTCPRVNHADWKPPSDRVDTVEKGEPKIRDNPPLIYHLSEQAGPEFEARVADAYARYRESLPDERRVLLDRYRGRTWP